MGTLTPIITFSVWTYLVEEVEDLGEDVTTSLGVDGRLVEHPRLETRRMTIVKQLKSYSRKSI